MLTEVVNVCMATLYGQIKRVKQVCQSSGIYLEHVLQKRPQQLTQEHITTSTITLSVRL